MPRSPPKLALHLSYRSALVILPPIEICSPIEQIRREHDRNFHRWPPHINLIYPFLKNSSNEDLKLKIDERVQNALHGCRPFSISFRKAEYFTHGKQSNTVWLRPELAAPIIENQLDPLQDLHQRLQREFKECDADQRAFEPHLSVGQARSRAAAERLATKTIEAVQSFATQVNESERRQQLAPTEAPDSDGSLDILVDRICFLERHGFNDRFKVVGVVRLDSNPASLQSIAG